jgi:hypothetical protein
MYQAQKRYWGDNPRPHEWLRMLVAAKYKLPARKKTPPPKKTAPSSDDAMPDRPFDWSSLDGAPSSAESGNGGAATPIKG